MFKCTVCQKLYNSRTDYCDCGNDIFEEVSAVESKPSPTVNLQQLVSGAIFASCLALSGWIWFGTSSPKPSLQPASQTQEIKKEVKNIPTIDKIWDNTPAYSSVNTNNPIVIYKSELQKTLYANLEETEIIDEGKCEIEFKVNENGKLTNRRIYKEKGGSQFNNLVVKMMRRTSSAEIPPDGYENSKFKAKIYTENGQIKISVR